MKGKSIEFDQAVDQLLLGEVADVSDAELLELLEIGGKLSRLPSPTVSNHQIINSLVHAVDKDKELKNRESFRKLLPITLLGRFAAIFMVLFLLSWSAVAASVDSVPGDFSYTIKRLSERIRLFIASAESAEVELNLLYSERRMDELLKVYKTDNIVNFGLVRAMIQQAAKALNKPDKLSKNDQEKVMDKVEFLLLRQQQILKQLEKSCSTEEREQLQIYIDKCNCTKQEVNEFKKKIGRPCLCSMAGATCKCDSGCSQFEEE